MKNLLLIVMVVLVSSCGKPPQLFDTFTYTIDKNGKEFSPKKSSQLKKLLQHRLELAGMEYSEIKNLGDQNYVIRLPKLDEQQFKNAKEILGVKAKLRFHPIHKDNFHLVQNYKVNPVRFRTPAGYKVKTIETLERSGEITKEFVFMKLRPEKIDGSHIQEAFASKNQFGRYYVSINFNKEGADLFTYTTRKMIGQRLAIVLDDKVFSAPAVQAEITGGQAQVTGSFTADEVKRLAACLGSGELPLDIVLEDCRKEKSKQ